MVHQPESWPHRLLPVVDLRAFTQVCWMPLSEDSWDQSCTQWRFAFVLYLRPFFHIPLSTLRCEHTTSLTTNSYHSLSSLKHNLAVSMFNADWDWDRIFSNVTRLIYWHTLRDEMNRCIYHAYNSQSALRQAYNNNLLVSVSGYLL